MLQACISKYKLTSIAAATHDQLLAMKIENTSRRYLVGACGDSTSCQGRIYAGVHFRSRNCFRLGKTTISLNFLDYYMTSTKSTLCVAKTADILMPTPTDKPTQIHVYIHKDSNSVSVVCPHRISFCNSHHESNNISYRPAVHLSNEEANA